MSDSRYVKMMLTVIAIALVFIAARDWFPAFDPLRSIRPNAALAQTSTPEYELAVPRSWGRMISYSNNNLLLEAPDGSLRVVDVEGKPPKYPKIKVHIIWQ